MQDTPVSTERFLGNHGDRQETVPRVNFYDSLSPSRRKQLLETQMLPDEWSVFKDALASQGLEAALEEALTPQVIGRFSTRERSARIGLRDYVEARLHDEGISGLNPRARNGMHRPRYARNFKAITRRGTPITVPRPLGEHDCFLVAGSRTFNFKGLIISGKLSCSCV